MYSYVEENQKEQLTFFKVIFTNFHFRGNEDEKPLKVDRGTPGFGKHSWNKTGIHCALQYKRKGHHSCNLSNNVIGNIRHSLRKVYFPVRLDIIIIIIIYIVRV